jgi:tellurite resistance protein TehA-like permease
MPQTTMLFSTNDRTTHMPTGRRSSVSRRRMSGNSLEGQRGTLRTSREGTLHGDLGIRDRLHHFTWAWFTCTMATGGISLVLAQTPHRFNGLTTIGGIVFIFDIVLFIIFTTGISLRFIMFPRTFVSSLSHPTESLFFPTFWISCVNILSCTQEYGVPHTGYWLLVVMRVMFWIYAALTFCIAIGQYFFLFTGKPLTIQSMTPAWILPIFPIMLCGTLASVMVPSQPPKYGLPILVAGLLPLLP